MMDVKFKTLSLWKTGKEVAVKCTKSLCNGISFEDFFSLYTSYLRVVVPASIEHAVDCVMAFFLFHLYLAYVLVFSVSLAILKTFKLKSGRIAPASGALREKAGVVLTYFFVAQSITKLTFGIPSIDRLMGWAFQVKPQINFKPQIKIGKSKSNESVVSVKSKMGTVLHVGFESEDEETRNNLKKLKKVSRGMEFATEMTDALIGTENNDGEEEDENWGDGTQCSFLSDENGEDSMCQVQKWLEQADAAAPEDIKKHVMRLVAQNEQMRRESLSNRRGSMDQLN